MIEDLYEGYKTRLILSTAEPVTRTSHTIDNRGPLSMHI